MRFDITKSGAGVERALQETSNPTHRAILETTGVI